jgi:glycosyltransferase involved in cell wall biosynthesis
LKPAILYYSDCHFFAGCENMLVNFFGSNELEELFDISFAYRYSPEYEQGLNSRVTVPVEKTAVRLYDHYELYNRIDATFGKAFRKPLKIIVNLLLIKYIYLLLNIFTLRKMVRSKKIDILHINNGGYPGAYSTIAMVLAARLCGIRRIVYVVNNIAQGYRAPERWLDYLFDKGVIRGVARFVTGSRYAGEQLHRNLGVPEAKIQYIHNGIAPRTVTETRTQVIRRLALPEDRPIFSVIAVLEARKGQVYALKALEQFKETYRDSPVPLCIIEGTGVDEAVLKQYVRDHALEDDVRFIAHESRIFNLINASDIIVVPSIKNEFPNIILEAMSLGKPIVACDYSDIPEQVEDMKSGLLVRPGDAAGLMHAIKKFLDNEALRTALGNNAKMTFDTQFTDKIATGRYVELYKQLIEEMPS